MGYPEQIENHQQRLNASLKMGGEKKLAKLKKSGVLNARERVEYLADTESFRELGQLAKPLPPESREKVPADGKVTGFCRVDGRTVAVVSNDFTSMGASSSPINTAKVGHIKKVATERGLPIVFLGESTGARMPDVMGARAVGAGSRPTQYLRLRETPWVAGVLGHCYGSSSWYAALSDFAVMRKGAKLAVSSFKLTSLAIAENISDEDLGGWKLHYEQTGLVDRVVDTDEQALDLMKQFLSYVPSHAGDAPPEGRAGISPELPGEAILDILPESRTKVYDSGKILKCIFDAGSVFELKKGFGKSIITALTRLDGKTVGVLANNPIIKGGAITPEACQKAISFFVLCDSFNIPIVFLVDQPGFLIGLDGERKGMIGRIMNWMNALTQITVPRIAVVMRKNYGQGILNMGGGGNADELASWFTAEINFMDPRSAVTIVHGVTQEDEPARYGELLSEMTKGTTAYDSAEVFGSSVVIHPAQSRQYLKDMLEVHTLRPSGGIGKHHLRNWPTSY